MKKMKLLLAVFAITVLTSANAYCVSFKVKNNTSNTYRVRVHDRGSFRPWVKVHPGFWGCVASSVKRADHLVEMEILQNGYWEPFYSGYHGSLSFTRIVKINPIGGKVQLKWYDEMPWVHNHVASGKLIDVVKLGVKYVPKVIAVF